jgi:hypothetical protein
MEFVEQIVKNWPHWAAIAFGIVISFQIAAFVLLEDA